MEINQAYDLWAAQYDTNQNATRDLEAQALRSTLAGVSVQDCLEIGCGTGKNTEWLMTRSDSVIAVDFSSEMLALARAKITSPSVQFIEADITEEWNFVDRKFDLVTFSLVLEHVRDLDPVFQKAAGSLETGGQVYLGELHPAKQYAGSKARFPTENGDQAVECFTHHVTDFLHSAKKHRLELIELNELFDRNDRSTTPRLLTLLFKKT